MWQLSRVRRWPAIAVLVGSCLLTFAALAAAVGGGERQVQEPRAAVVTQPTIEVAPPPKPKPATTEKEQPKQDPMEIQGSRNESAQSSQSAASKGGGSGGSTERAVGRMVMTGYAGAYPSQELLARARAGKIGGVILMGENVGAQTAQAIGALQRAAGAAGRKLLIATDQEGGQVKRFPSLAPASAAPAIPASRARAAGYETGRGLASFGVNTDLAPVADVAHPGSFMIGRAFSSSPAQVARSACAFAQGLQQAGVNATLKHFPGLGYARRNTDVSASVVRAGQRALSADLAPYRSCKPALVMMSNASYPALDGGPAVFSRRIVQDLLRGQLGYGGVVISDSLSATSVASPTTAVRAARAGVDMLLYIDPQISSLAYEKVLAAVRAGQIPRAQVRASAQRIKQAAGG